MPTLAELLQQALAHHSANRLADAEKIYRELIQAEPRCSPAWHLLGVIAHQVGANDTAAEYIRHAISLEPNDPAYYSNMGEVLRAQNKHGDAIGMYQRALQLNPQQAEAYNNLGNCLDEIGRHEEAKQCLERAIQINPNYAAAWSNLGNALKGLTGYDVAVQCYQKAVQLDPNFAQAHNNLGALLEALGQPQPAEQCFREAIRSNANFVDPWYNLGGVLKRGGKYIDAARAFLQALQLKPDYAEAHNNLAVTLKDLGHHHDALRHCRLALQYRQNYVEAHNNTAVVTEELGLLDEALHHYRAALALKPRFTEVRSGWLLALNYHPDIDLPTLAAEHRKWGEEHGMGHPQVEFKQSFEPGRKIRLGFISPDFRRHPVANFLTPYMTHFDPEHFEVYLYDDVEAPDIVSERLKPLGTKWTRIVGMRDDQVTQVIRDHEIDVLFDMAGHTSRGRLMVFCRRAAPVQVSYIGYPNSTGVPTMDYLLTDSVADEPSDQQYYTEKLGFIEGSWSCYRPRDDAPEVAPSPAVANGYVTFGSLHNLAKLNRAVLDLWCEVLHAVPNSKMLLFRTPFFGEVGERFRQEFVNRGIDASRIDIRYQVPQIGYQTVYNEIDIALDVFPWTGHTTACEAMWMGVPTIAFMGNRHAGRMVASVLTAAGHSEWVGKDKADYVAIAKRMAADIPQLGALRSGLRQAMSASQLCDEPGYARRFEATIRQIWQETCAKSVPQLAQV